MFSRFLSRHAVLGLKLLASIAFAELLIMTAFESLHVEKWMSPPAIGLADAAILSIVSTVMIYYWVVRPMKTMEEFSRVENDLRESEVRYRRLFESSKDGIIILDFDDGMVLDMNPFMVDLLGYPRQEYVGRIFWEIGHLSGLADKVNPEALKDLRRGGFVRFEGVRLATRDGRDVVVEFMGNVYRVEGKLVIQCNLRDITERMKAEEQVHFLAYYDSLTGLPNRNFFKELLGRTISYSTRYQKRFAVILLNLDDFKKINDTLGHDAGDRLLQAVSPRLLGSIRGSDYAARMSGQEDENVARLGGDEFMVLIHELADARDAGRVARRILGDLSQPFALDKREVYITASIGIATYPDDGTDVDTMLKNADMALNHAKKGGKNTYQFYSSSMNIASLELFTLESNLHRALERDELLLHYQPKLDLASGEIIGTEALVRWRQPEIGLVPPGKFIPVAEECGLIIPIGSFVLRTACLQNRRWQDLYPGLRVAVNVSCRQFGHANLTKEVFDILDRTGLSPDCLELEITETTVMQKPDDAILILNELKRAGIKIMIDDFGTGYSSMNYLRRLPVDALKIDISFIRNVVTNPSDAIIVKTIIAMAHNLGIKVIAEGVEDKLQLEFLREHGCDIIQGYLLSPPLPAGDCQALLERHTQAGSFI